MVFLFLWSYRKKFKHDGDAFFTYAFLYGFERMFVEGLRGDSLYLIQPGELFAQGIRVSQLGSFVAVVAIGIFFLVRRAKEKKLGRLIWPAPEVAGASAEPEDQPEPVQAEGDVMVEQVEAVFFTQEAAPDTEKLEEDETQPDESAAQGKPVETNEDEAQQEKQN